MAPGLLYGGGMDPLEILTAEHRDAERLLDALEALAARDGATGRGALGRVVAALRATVHDGHVAREEELLFAQLVDSGFPMEAGPVAVLRAEHAEGDARLALLERAARDAGAEPWGRVAEVIRAYVAGLRHHLAKEEACLFPAARAYLSAAAMQRLATRFAHHPLTRGEKP